mmetsp:Transcript_32119/g.51950  ORF Transcript_32119/g.51950 Transcript_32119/m.51950 type:complete len:446 (-) Transcript_32119:657-1994(-)
MKLGQHCFERVEADRARHRTQTRRRLRAQIQLRLVRDLQQRVQQLHHFRQINIKIGLRGARTRRQRGNGLLLQLLLVGLQALANHVHNVLQVGHNLEVAVLLGIRGLRRIERVDEHLNGRQRTLLHAHLLIRAFKHAKQRRQNQAMILQDIEAAMRGNLRHGFQRTFTHRRALVLHALQARSQQIAQVVALDNHLFTALRHHRNQDIARFAAIRLRLRQQFLHCLDRNGKALLRRNVEENLVQQIARDTQRRSELRLFILLIILIITVIAAVCCCVFMAMAALRTMHMCCCLRLLLLHVVIGLDDEVNAQREEGLDKAVLYHRLRLTLAQPRGKVGRLLAHRHGQLILGRRNLEVKLGQLLHVLLDHRHFRLDELVEHLHARDHIVLVAALQTLINHAHHRRDKTLDDRHLLLVLQILHHNPNRFHALNLNLDRRVVFKSHLQNG